MRGTLSSEPFYNIEKTLDVVLIIIYLYSKSYQEIIDKEKSLMKIFQTFLRFIPKKALIFENLWFNFWFINIR